MVGARQNELILQKKTNLVLVCNEYLLTNLVLVCNEYLLTCVNKAKRLQRGSYR